MIDRRIVTDAVLELLGRGTGKAWGDHVIPEVDGEDEPYGVLYAIPGGAYTGPALRAPDADAELVYQTTCVGHTRSQAEWLMDRARRSLVARTPTGAFQVELRLPENSGIVVVDRATYGGGSGVDPEGQPPHGLFSAAERFSIYTTPG